ncbi:hypothetical protein FOCG_16674 [Fusarium oxysporum f. sp. radicis-lycopersici 26381]|nr:hypothetical protein FOWG_04494 [Fusarium oxysporum f. sp. lycopersici MN25]EXL40912.1 hypothetical protein FOCG_16674 [Fusarium oxysporum f. sp. radicis-lycopersici 26381]
MKAKKKKIELKDYGVEDRKLLQVLRVQGSIVGDVPGFVGKLRELGTLWGQYSSATNS